MYLHCTLLLCLQCKCPSNDFVFGENALLSLKDRRIDFMKFVRFSSAKKRLAWSICKIWKVNFYQNHFQGFKNNQKKLKITVRDQQTEV